MKGISSAMGKGVASRLGDDEVPVGRYVYECLPHARRPFDLDPADTGCAAQAKVHHGLARPRLTVAVGRKDVLLAIVVDVEHAGTPTAPGQAARGKPAEQRHLRESAAPEITKQREGFVG